MKSEITSLDLYYLVKEFQSLVGARIDKIYEQDIDKKEFLLVFHKSSSGKSMLRIKLPNFAYITEFKQAFPEKPPGFCTFLRKHLASAKIKEIRQRGFERILEIVFDTKEGESILVCELFSKGNMILTDSSLKIRGLLESQNWQSRTIRGGVVYEYPPIQANTSMLSEQEFNEIIKKSIKDSLVKTLAIDFGLGGIYSEELCLRAKIDKNEKKVGSPEIKKLFNALKQMIDEKTKPNKLGDDFFPFETTNHEKKPVVFFESFNKALDSELSEKISTVAEQNNIKELSKKESKAAVVLQKQKERLAELEQSVVENQKRGELIYEHYTEIKELLDNINADRKKLSWEELKKKYSENKLIKEIDETKGIIRLEL